ncbi:MAG: HDOD domain-containing protein [Candidatus Acidiferrales bacterium]
MSTRTQPCTIDRIALRTGAPKRNDSAASHDAPRDLGFAPAFNSPLERFAGIDAQLNRSSVDLKSVCDAIRCDPLLAGRVVQLSRALAGDSGAGISCIEEAVVLQGAKRFRMTLLSAALLDLRSRAAFPLNDPGLVRHGVLSALAGERLARRAGYPRADLAYLLALVHPLGNSHGRRICRRSRGVAAEAEADSPERGHDGNTAARSIERAANPDWHFDPPLASLLGRQLNMHEVRLDSALVRIVELACAKACSRSREVLEWSCALEALGN